MAIQTTTIGASSTTVYTSVGNTALTFLSICNVHTTALIFSVNIVPNGVVVGNDNMFVKDLEILAGDTYVVYQGGEKIVLGNGDYISITSNVGNVSTAIASFVEV